MGRRPAVLAMERRGEPVSSRRRLPDRAKRQRNDRSYPGAARRPAGTPSADRQSWSQDSTRAPHMRASGGTAHVHLQGDRRMKIFVFGSSITSSYWNGAAREPLARVEQNPDDQFRKLVPEYDLIFTYGGGPPVIERYVRLGAANCHPIYNALDPETHHPVAADSNLCSDVLFVGNRLPDRERRVDEFFFRAAELAPACTFILGGEGWAGKAMPENVRWIGHVSTDDHNRLNCSARFVLNINRDSMADVGFSPPTRVFEAAGAGACLITDRWAGIEMFFSPGRELLVARNAAECAEPGPTVSLP